ncbi:GIY-YIG nuclease family protein [Spiroplasma diminutum]|uniref:GIY-YIG domain-containing protein n=1 Tax=Spiroplasma diminutum CUAS-1 TaxID=1276221 RepID=S5M0X3_9MOLU|nr:GIY-YIG nuclease family protein [Spiroplasma diminutum]AGR42501.1 hypothetical protein SDIMI_v3c07970 [Spiroplasma diminutum CUAS-1]
MDIDRQYKFIYKTKYSWDIRIKKFSENYLIKLINKFEYNRTKLTYLDIKNRNDIISGTYLLYSIINDKPKFCYIGESKNVYLRFKQHINGYLNGKDKLYSKIRKRVKNLEDITFLVLNEIEDQNKRLMKETYYIYATKSKFFSLNSKLVSRRMRCPNNHGCVKSRLAYDKNSEKLKLLIYGNCKNKECKTTFLIK